jgi:hypothetical protein
LLRAGLFLDEQSMSRVPWPKFLHRQAQAHLVVGVVAQAEGPVGGDELTAVRKLLNRLVRHQKLGGDYATTVGRDTGRPEVYFAFVEEAAARKFGEALQAQATDHYPGWASQRAFDLPDTKLASLEAIRRPETGHGKVTRKDPDHGCDAARASLLAGATTTSDPSMPPREPSANRYVVEIRDVAGTSLLLTTADWTARERDLAISAVLRLVGMKATAPAKQQGNKAGSGHRAPKAKRSQKS